MKESIAHTTRLCVACGRPGYHPRKEVAPCYQPTCGPCCVWSNLLHTSHILERVGQGMPTLDSAVRTLVRGAEREGRAHTLMMRKLGEITQFAADFAPPLTTKRT